MKVWLGMSLDIEGVGAVSLHVVWLASRRLLGNENRPLQGNDRDLVSGRNGVAESFPFSCFTLSKFELACRREEGG